MTSANSTPIAVDFLSDPGPVLGAIQRVEKALQSLHARMAGLTRDGELLLKTLTNPKMVSVMQQTAAAVASTTNHMRASVAQAGAFDANITRGLNNTTLLTQRLNMAASAAARLKANSPGNVRSSGSTGVSGSSSSGTGDGDSGLTFLPRITAPAAISATVAAAGAYSVKSAIDYEQAIARVVAVGELQNKPEEVRALMEATRGGSGQFSALSKARGLQELVAAGMTAQQAGASLGDTLNLATAGEIEMSRAAEIMVASMSAFNIKAKDSARVVDSLTAAANLSPASIEDMGEAMKYVAPVGSALGIAIEDVSASMAVLAQNGIRGGNAGRGLGAILARLLAPAEDAKEAILGLGISLESIDPTKNSLGDVFKQLGKMDQPTLVRMFGAEGLDISNVLANNADKFQKIADKVRDMEGAGARFAETLRNTTQGTLTEMLNKTKDAASNIGKLALDFDLGFNGTLMPKGTSLRNAMEGVGELADIVTGIGQTPKYSMRYGGAVGTRFYDAARTAYDQIQAASSPAEVASLVESLRQRYDRIRTGETIDREDIRGEQTLFSILDDAQSINARARRAQMRRNIARQAREEKEASMSWADRAAQKAPALANLVTKAADYLSGTFMSGLGKKGPVSYRDWSDHEAVGKGAVGDEVAARMSIAEAVARAKGDTATADRLKQVMDVQATFSQLRSIGMDGSEAMKLALSSQAIANSANLAGGGVVASSLREIGGGGGAFVAAPGAMNMEAEQLAVQRGMASSLETLVSLAKRGGSAIRAFIR